MDLVKRDKDFKALLVTLYNQRTSALSDLRNQIVQNQKKYETELEVLTAQRNELASSNARLKEENVALEAECSTMEKNCAELAHKYSRFVQKFAFHDVTMFDSQVTPTKPAAEPKISPKLIRSPASAERQSFIIGPTPASSNSHHQPHQPPGEFSSTLGTLPMSGVVIRETPPELQPAPPLNLRLDPESPHASPFLNPPPPPPPPAAPSNAASGGEGGVEELDLNCSIVEGEKQAVIEPEIQNQKAQRNEFPETYDVFAEMGDGMHHEEEEQGEEHFRRDLGGAFDHEHTDETTAGHDEPQIAPHGPSPPRVPEPVEKPDIPAPVLSPPPLALTREALEKHTAKMKQIVGPTDQPPTTPRSSATAKKKSITSPFPPAEIAQPHSSSKKKRKARTPHKQPSTLTFVKDEEIYEHGPFVTTRPEFPLRNHLEDEDSEEPIEIVHPGCVPPTTGSATTTPKRASSAKHRTPPSKSKYKSVVIPTGKPTRSPLTGQFTSPTKTVAVSTSTLNRALALTGIGNSAKKNRHSAPADLSSRTSHVPFPTAPPAQQQVPFGESAQKKRRISEPPSMVFANVDEAMGLEPAEFKVPAAPVSHRKKFSSSVSLPSKPIETTANAVGSYWTEAPPLDLSLSGEIDESWLDHEKGQQHPPQQLRAWRYTPPPGKPGAAAPPAADLSPVEEPIEKTKASKKRKGTSNKESDRATTVVLYGDDENADQQKSSKSRSKKASASTSTTTSGSGKTAGQAQTTNGTTKKTPTTGGNNTITQFFKPPPSKEKDIQKQKETDQDSDTAGESAPPAPPINPNSVYQSFMNLLKSGSGTRSPEPASTTTFVVPPPQPPPASITPPKKKAAVSEYDVVNLVDDEDGEQPHRSGQRRQRWRSNDLDDFAPPPPAVAKRTAPVVSSKHHQKQPPLPSRPKAHAETSPGRRSPERPVAVVDLTSGTLEEPMPDFGGPKKPASSEKGYKFKDVVRKRSERAQLEAIECEECQKFFDAMAGEVDREEMRQFCGRHRHRHAPPSTPPGFWELESMDPNPDDE